VDPELIAKGLRDMISSNKTLLSEEQAREVMMNFRKEMQAKNTDRMKKMQAQQAEKTKDDSEKNKREGDAFLAENKKKPGVITTPSGLQYKVITMGTGRKPTENDTVITHYRGTFIDGKEFDSSYRRGEPFITPVTKVIKGWTEALEMMPVGSKWQLVLPPTLAYGQGGPGIPPNSVLLFDMELVGIQDSPSAAATPAK
ncbi:MAG TPA: FKBP-type peptidyl-prolyl cis-trans isomerase, partial [Verrucomicrobiae bacterium]|jgi:FKBP-type peptidyl-prolyl cis-trans isomerase